MIRHVDCGSCNGCEHGLTLVSGSTVGLPRYGLGIVASPRHADVLLTAYAAMPEARRVAALGDWVLGCEVLGSPLEIDGWAEG